MIVVAGQGEARGEGRGAGGGGWGKGGGLSTTASIDQLKRLLTNFSVAFYCAVLL